MTPRVRAPRRFVSLSLAALAVLAAPCLTLASTTLSFSYTSPAVPIPDSTGEDIAGAPAFASIDVSGFGALDVITNVTFRFDGDSAPDAFPADVGLDHTFVGDLKISLISPASTEVLLIDQVGSAGQNFAQTVLDDAAATSIQSLTSGDAPFTGTFAPDTPLATFIGELANGTWMLKAQDFFIDDTGNIRRFTITITAASGLAATHWLGGTDSTWTGNNWASDATGTPTLATPTAADDITFAATGAANQVNTNLDAAFTINSLTINSATGISSAGAQTLNVNTTTAVNSVLSVNNSVILAGGGALTIDAAGTLAGDGAVQMAADQSIFANGAISVGDPSVIAGAAVLSLTTSGTGSIVMGSGSMLRVDLFTGAGLGDNTGIATAADQLSLNGTLDASAGGTLVIGNPNAMTSYAGGDQWQLVDLNGGAGSITGTLAVDDSSLGLATGFSGTFDQTTGIYSIADYRPEMSATDSGLPFANAESQVLIAGNGTVTNDINNHLFILRAGGGEESDDEGGDGSISASMDVGVVMGQGDGPDSAMARRIKPSRQWQAFATVNYGNVRLSPINKQAGVQVDAWASGVGIERHVSRGMTLGFAFSYLQSKQNYTNGLGSVDLEGPALSAYLSYVRKNVWCNLLYTFGDYNMGTSRNPGFGFAAAQGSTTTYTNSLQFNTGYSLRFQNNTLVMGPFVGVDYLHGTVEGYSETGGGPAALSFARQTFESLVTRVGWSVSKKITTDWAVITPQVRLSYERQNVRNNGTSVTLINAPFTATGGHQSPGQDYMVLGGGINFQFTPTLSLLLNYQTQIFRNNLTAQFGSVRVGYKF
ncbi:MAG: autotransporter domain-containing protein [Prosthecobacter sp.]|uniref:autotransporter domain-containing protein n=1 Tax=Prosthecobacter sp. TaxID=1965333 RepID=UPI0026004A29|nr:autotransporter domain-containing protein [Prosthecobacter sp.]MCF7788403.1 autotransporter domain-containing protein [Prosthecobacter sp.]